MLEHFKGILIGQFEASHCMLRECIEKCPPEHWDGLIAKYAFWHVSYHVLCFVDCYLSKSNETFQLRDIHPNGMQELDDEYPSRRFTKPELLEYATVLRPKIRESIASETRESLEGPSGFAHLSFSRAELHVYNIRHVQHHAGQLGAFLRRHGVDLRWVKTGWR